MAIKTVAIIGFGGLGSMYASHLSTTMPSENLAVIATANRVARYQKEGLVFNGEARDLNFLSYEEVTKPFDLVIYAVKYHDLPQAIAQSRKLVGPDTTLLSVLNGITSEELLTDAFGQEHVLLCVAQQMDSSKDGPFVSCGSIGVLALGVNDEHELPRLALVTNFFDSVKLPYIIPADIKHQLWGKLMLNTGVNQACAVFDCDFAGVQAPGEARNAMIGAMREVALVASKRGINLSEEDLKYWVDIIDALNPRGKPSLRQDVLAQKKTEVDLFSGTICALGDQCGIETPINDLFYKKIRELEASW